MRSLFRFIVRYHFFFLFLLVETLSVGILIQYNRYHRAGFINFTDNIQGFMFDRLGGIMKYTNLRKINQDLAAENNLLRNQLDDYNQLIRNDEIRRIDSLPGRLYTYTPAIVVNNSVNKQYNYVTLNKGKKHGIREEMAVISPEGVVGVVYGASSHYSTVISLLNRDFRLSAKIRKNDYYGSLYWTGGDYRHATLSEIPYHVELEVGDTIVTSGYSAIFPEGLMVGVIFDFEQAQGNFYIIDVELSVDFRKLTHVNVVRNLLVEEQVNLENNETND
jgi:rod shape-determining protein MreC